MPEMRTIEEFIRGPDGDNTQGLMAAIESVKKQAAQEEIDRVWIECRTTPAGTTASRQEFKTSVQIDSTVEQIAGALQNHMERSPGDTFSGEIRINFRSYRGNHHILAFSRKMRPAISGGQLVSMDPDGQGGSFVTTGDLARASQVYFSLVKPISDQHLRLMSEATGLLMASAEVVKSTHRPNGDTAGGDGLVPDLFRGLMHMAEDEKNNGGQQNGGRVAGGGGVPMPAGAGARIRPPGPPGMARPALKRPPGPGSIDQPGPQAQTPMPSQPPRQITQEAVTWDTEKLSASEVESGLVKWLRANPKNKEAARRLVPTLAKEL